MTQSGHGGGSSAAQLPMCEHKSTENASSQIRPCAKISTMSDNPLVGRQPVASNCTGTSDQAPITAEWRASRRPGTGQQRRARRRGVQSRAQAYVFNVFGWLAEAAPSLFLSSLWVAPSWPFMFLEKYTQSTLNVARHAKKSEVEGEIESQIESQKVQEGQASSAAQGAEGCCQYSGAGGCCNGSSRLRRQARSRRSGVKRRRGATSF